MKNNPPKLDIQEVIIVEGKTDSQKLKKIFGNQIQTIETNGLNLNPKILTLIQEINTKQGIIVFTDPDGPGKKIRQMINDSVNGEVKNAFINKSDIQKNSKKIGIAEADEQAIKTALTNLITFKPAQESLSWNDYLNHDFYLKENRIKFCQHFNFDEKMSSKTLFKWLNLMGLNANNLQQILEQ